MMATGTENKDERVKVAIMLHTIREDALEVYNTLHVEMVSNKQSTMDDILDAFREYCIPKKNIVTKYHQFGLLSCQRD